MISCHLGGSSSLTAIDAGKSVMTTMGMTPQTGLPQNNRVGDFDPFALPLIIERTGMSSTKSWPAWPAKAVCWDSAAPAATFATWNKQRTQATQAHSLRWMCLCKRSGGTWAA